jgi:beta-glucosidase
MKIAPVISFGFKRPIASFMAILTTLTLLAQGYEESGTERTYPVFPWPEGKKMAISLTFDDARPSQIDKGLPVLERYGVKATFYISPDRLIQRMDGWERAVALGHDIGNHSLVHPCTGNFAFARDKALEDYTLEQMGMELDSASRWIEEVLGITPVSFGYPCGQTYVGRGSQSRSYVPLVSAMFETGRTWMDEGPNDPVVCDLARLTGMELDGKQFDQVLALIEQARERGSWLILAGHEMDQGGLQTSLLATIDSICRYATDPENGIWIDHVSNVGRYVREQRGIPAHSAMLPYQNPVLPVASRIDDLVSRMTLEEKIGQLNMPCGYFSELGRTVQEKQEGSRKFVRGDLPGAIGPGGGFFTLPNNVLHEGPDQQARFMNELQTISMEHTRLKIPLLQTEEGTHGLMCAGATIFPEGPALGSTWNLDLVHKVYSTAAREARAVGIHQLFTLVIEPNRDPRLGRNQEGYSEDPFMCSSFAATIVNAVQGDDLSASDRVVAGLCHYPGQSQPVSGLERGAMEISERTLREVFLPPWEAGIKKGGALGVMATYPTIDGIPAHSSSKILTGILRGELGFEGLVLSEGNGVNTLVYTGLAESEKEAAAMVANAGMDVSISFNQGYFHEMIENVDEGRVSLETIDRSVRRVLEQKFRLGLFENPFVDPHQASKVSHTPENQELALEAAREGIVLLRNENGILPLHQGISSIAVIGPNADDERNQLGDYTSEVVLQEITTVLEGIEEKIGRKGVQYVKGCNVIGKELNEIEKAVKAAGKSDVAVVVLGENEWQRENHEGTSGEGYDVATLEITGLQKELIRRVHATGTPTIVVLINGRALATPWISENIPGIIEAWIPGEKGGKAVADILFGDVNPSGKLPVTIPRHAGQLPVYYNHKPSKSYWLEKGWGNSYADLEESSPLYEFGFGLSYTTFNYSNLDFSSHSIGPNGTITVTCEIRNTGERAGAEVVQLYIHDKLSSVVRPVKELKGFDKIVLEAGESKQVSFDLGFDELRMLDKAMNWMVEPGEFEVMIGSSSEDIRLKGAFQVVRSGEGSGSL